MIWSRQQVSQAQGIRARFSIDDSYARDEDALQSFMESAFRSMNDMANDFGLDLDARDICSSSNDVASQSAVEVVCWWQPPTTTIELHGGQSDGTRLTLPKDRMGERVRIPIHQSSLLNSQLPTAAFESASYELSGWNEVERVWVYEEMRHG